MSEHREHDLMQAAHKPIGVVLAGGSGRRIGGAKALARLKGTPLISYPLAALGEALGEVAIVAKADTALPSLPGITVWVEPETPHHPVVGLRQALALAQGRPVLACAADLPFVGADLIRCIARADPGEALAVVACSGNEVQPLLGCYRAEAIEVLRAVDPAAGVAMREVVAAMNPRRLEVNDPEELFNVNSPEDLLLAGAMLERRSRRLGAGRL